MPSLHEFPFRPISSTNATVTSFNATASTAALFALEATGREWQFPNRTVRVSSKASDDFFIQFGTSSVIATTSGSMLVLGGVSEVFRVTPAQSWVSIASSTDVTVNVTLGSGF